ncbi:MAG: hypothetical protein EBS84_19435 [Proteobacteria bacterium]|nr:hypothetical protein [Verrucomicrobiota bacterium]NBU11160.1 hypothetical protein [Pseudomonadota bacterium]
MAAPNPYIGLTSAELATQRAATLAAISACKGAGESYSGSGRSTSRNLATLQQDLAWINQALAISSGSRVTKTFADFSSNG